MTKLSFPLLESTESDDDVILISPWRIYDSRPTYLSEMLQNGESQKQNSQINCLMNSRSSDSRLTGQLDQFCNMWVIKCENNNDIDICLEKLELKYSILHVNLVERKVFKDSIEIPMLVFINNKSETIETLKNNLKMVKKAGQNGKHFSYEVDYGPAVEKWASDVLKRDFVCIGGRFCITNSDSFNHVLDWSNLLGCLVCLPCGLMAGSAYRIGRKARYLENMWTPKQEVVLVGATGRDCDSQRDTLLKLIEWMSEEPQQNKPPIDEPEPSAPPEMKTIREEAHEIKEISNHPSTSGMPEVDSESTFKRTYRYDPLSYPRLMSFLTVDKATDASKSKDSKRTVISTRKNLIRKTDNAKNRRPLLRVRSAVGESKV